MLRPPNAGSGVEHQGARSLVGLQTWDLVEVCGSLFHLFGLFPSLLQLFEPALGASGKGPLRVQMPHPNKAALTQWSKDMDEVMSSLDAIKETMGRNVTSDVTVVIANKQPLVSFAIL